MEEKEKTQRASYQTIIEILKGLTGLVIVIYFLGFLVVGSFMMSYGYISLDLLNARYLGAGVLYAFSMLVTLSVCFEVHEKIGFLNRARDKFLYRATKLVGLLFIFVFAVVLSSYLILTDVTLRGRIFFIGWFVMNYFMHLFLAKEFLEEFRHIRLPPSVSVNMLIILEFLVVFLFGIMVYPVVPSSLVGGKPENVKLLLNESTLVESFPFKRDGHYSENLKLLDATDKAYLLLIKVDRKDKLFELDKDFVAGVIYGVKEKRQKADSTSVTGEEATNKKIHQAHNGDGE